MLGSKSNKNQNKQAHPVYESDLAWVYVHCTTVHRTNGLTWLGCTTVHKTTGLTWLGCTIVQLCLPSEHAPADQHGLAADPQLVASLTPASTVIQQVLVVSINTLGMGWSIILQGPGSLDYTVCPLKAVNCPQCQGLVRFSS